MEPLDMKCSRCGFPLTGEVFQSFTIDGAWCSAACMEKDEATDGEPNE